ncbi:MAG: hypothetical protein ACI92G_000529 [Candidatus Pelagisphaera sp.]|jgi:hypothetical protein
MDRATTSGRAAQEDQTNAARRDVVALPLSVHSFEKIFWIRQGEFLFIRLSICETGIDLGF